MEEYRTKVKELESLLGLDDPESVKKKEELTAWLAAHKTPENVKIATDMFVEGVTKAADDIRNLRAQLNSEQYKVLPLSYIAKEYFGKSAAWLYQRINGIPLRGRTYTLNDEQKATFNAAVQDIAKRIGSIRIA